jgi:CHRD domain
LNYVLRVTNIHSVIGAHIHRGNAQQNGPVVLILFGNLTMTGRPTGVVNGVLSKGTITASDLKGPLAGNQLSALVNLIRSGNAYVNVHTTQNPKSEGTNNHRNNHRTSPLTYLFYCFRKSI